MKLATWNVNSIKMRMPHVQAWLKEHQPDVLMLQEIKCETEKFPDMEFKALGYQCLVKGQKTYNGVALLAKEGITAINHELPGDGADDHARYLEADIGGLRVICLYLPNGNPIATDKFAYKHRWMSRLKTHAAQLMREEKAFVMGGDFNVIPEAIDVYNPAAWENDALYHPATRATWREITSLGLTDAFRALHPAKEHAYTFWDYQAGAWQRDQGLRIDHFLLSPEAADRLISCTIDRAPRGQEKASDHTPVIVELAA